MASNADSPLDLLWKEYSINLTPSDDLSVARWLAQTLGQLEGKAWRDSRTHYWGRIVSPRRRRTTANLVQTSGESAASYIESPCCRAPMLPMLTRDVREAGLICEHCSDSLVPFDEIPEAVRGELESWAKKYQTAHAVAHWDDRQRKAAGDYEGAVEKAAAEVEGLLVEAGKNLAVRLLEFYPTVVWEDQDECLEVRPEDVRLK